MRAACRVLLLLFVMAMTLTCMAQDEERKDAEGCTDSPLITRMPGSQLKSCDHKEFDQLQVPAAKNADGDVQQKTLEGELWTWDYGTRDGMSEIQVYRNMLGALKQAGFQIIYENSPQELT